MRKKLLKSMKLILVMALLGVGVNEVWAEDITTLPYNKTWLSTDAAEATSPFSGGTVETGTNVTALSVNNTTATAWFDIDTSTDGKQAYTLVTDEEVAISLTAYHGWLNSGKSQGVKLLNSGGYTLAEYVYNVGSCNITDVKIGGSTASGFSAAYNCQSKYNSTKNANGFTNNPYVTTDGWNPTITFKVRSDGYVTLNISMSAKSIDNTYTGQLPAEWDVDIANIQAYAGSDNADRTLAINNLSITSAVAARADYTVRYVDSESNQIDEDVVYSGVVGTVPTLISADKANRYNAAGTLKYVYTSDDASSKTIESDGSTVVTVTFTSYEKYDYSVTTSNGVNIDSGSLFDDETKVVSWSKYIEKDGVYYQTTAPFQFTVTKDAPTKEVSMTESQVTQFVETTSGNWASTGVDNENLSGGNAYRGVSAGGTKTMLTVAESGVYSINYAVFSTNTNSTFDFSLYKNDASDETNLIETVSVSYSINYVLSTGTRTVNNVTLEAGDKIIAKSGNSTCALDYIALAKTGGANTITSGNATHLTFNNATNGSAYGENWVIDVWNGGSKVAKVRADWWDEVAGTNTGFTYGYTYSSDGGATPDNTNVWGTFVSDMGDADVDLTLSYTEGTLYIIGTMTNGSKVYYVNYTKSGLSGDVSFDVYGNNATLTDITTAATTVNTTYATPAGVPTTVTDAGYATWVTNNVYPLDFTSTDIEAYKVKVSKKGVATLTKLTTVPAGTPVLLYKDGGTTENIPVAASASAVTDNDLVAGTTTTATEGVATIDGDYTNMILNIVDEKIGFYYAAGNTVATNRAYLHILTTLAPDAEREGARMTMVFADEETGINSLTPDPSPKGEGSIYTLSGQRVSKPMKGLYIIDGKKVLVNDKR